MRNLQKILALVLALIMSFSLVTTAGAFSDDGDITASYTDAVKVLNGLEVFKGYDNGATFQPKGSITRAEVAAIIYRIATGDVKDTQASIYSSYGQFTDVLDGSWYAGYVNYCANAGYIKGRGNKIFDPQGQVTGYEALAMILRTMGYDKNSEFTGTNWQVRTASIANERTITKNVTSTQLGQAATREVVAEILFRSILANKVNFNANTLSYTQAATSIGYDSFKLEEVTGVVVANEFADLYDTDVLANGKTDLEVDGTVRHLDIASELTDIGESRHAYIAESKVLALGDTGTNVVFEPENGKGVEIDTDKKFRDVSGLTKTDDTQFYVNFGRTGNHSSDHRIEFRVEFHGATAASAKAVQDEFEDYYDVNVADTMNGGKQAAYTAGAYTYEKIIRADADISDDDLKVIRGIFGAADRDRNTTIWESINGDVYIGTKSNGDKDDLSDEISYREFEKTYINTETYDVNWNKSDNGEWVKIVDNNSDGKADYAFLTEYWMDKAIHSRTKNGETVLEYNYLDDDDYDFRYLEDIVIDDVVLYTLIDGQALIQKAESVEKSVNYVSFKDEIIRTTDSDEYGQSGIYNKTTMDQLIVNMDENVAYKLYFDVYGYVRAYELVEKTPYGLLTELYWGKYDNNGRFIANRDLTAELKGGKAKVEEYDVANDSTVFEGKRWSDLDEAVYNVADDRYGNVSDRIVLQPATAHLGLSGKGQEDTALYFRTAMTNVAKYTISDNEVKLTSAAEYAYDENGQRLYYNRTSTGWEKNNINNADSIPVYAVDYIELDGSKTINADQRVYDIKLKSNNNVMDETLLNKSVYATHDTEYYIVGNNNKRIEYFSDYTNLPKIDVTSTPVKAMYAVARNTANDRAEMDYWVADVVVIEVDSWDSAYDSISFAFYNENQETSRDTKRINTLNNKSSDPELTVVPDYSWGRAWTNYGFYMLYETEMDGSELVADRIEKIPAAGKTYADYSIYAGQIRHINATGNRGDYMAVDLLTTDKDRDDVGIKNTKFYSIDVTRKSVSNPLYVAEELHAPYGNAKGDFDRGDYVIWIENGDGDAIFAVIVSLLDSKDIQTSPSWLYNQYNIYDRTTLMGQILEDQRTTGPIDPVDPYPAATAAYNAAKDAYNDAKVLDLKDADTLNAAKTALDKAKEELDKITDGTRDTEKANVENWITEVTEAIKALNPGGDKYTVTVKFVDENGPVEGADIVVGDKATGDKVTIDIPETITTAYTVTGADVEGALNADKTAVKVTIGEENVIVTVTLKKINNNPNEVTVTFVPAGGEPIQWHKEGYSNFYDVDPTLKGEVTFTRDTENDPYVIEVGSNCPEFIITWLETEEDAEGVAVTANNEAQTSWNLVTDKSEVTLVISYSYDGSIEGYNPFLLTGGEVPENFFGRMRAMLLADGDETEEEDVRRETINIPPIYRIGQEGFAYIPVENGRTARIGSMNGVQTVEITDELVAIDDSELPEGAAGAPGYTYWRVGFIYMSGRALVVESVPETITFSITVNGANLTVAPTTVTGDTELSEVTLTLTSANEKAIKLTSIEVGERALQSTAYDFDSETGTITFKTTAGTADGNIVITAAEVEAETDKILTVTIGENITSVTVKMTYSDAEGAAAEKTETLTATGTVSVPEGAAVEFTVVPAEGFEEDRYSGNIPAMTADTNVSFTVKPIPTAEDVTVSLGDETEATYLTLTTNPGTITTKTAFNENVQFTLVAAKNYSTVAENGGSSGISIVMQTANGAVKLVEGTHFIYRKATTTDNNAVISLVANDTYKTVTGDITITKALDSTGIATISVFEINSANGAKGSANAQITAVPEKVAEAATLSSLEITLKIKDDVSGYKMPEKLPATNGLKVTSQGSTTDRTSASKYVYNKEDGTATITIKATGTVEAGGIEICLNAEKTVSPLSVGLDEDNNPVVTPAKAGTSCTYKYAIVEAKGTETPDDIVRKWQATSNASGLTEAVAAAALGVKTTDFGVSPTVTPNDGGKYLVVISVNSVEARIVAAGCYSIPRNIAQTYNVSDVGSSNLTAELTEGGTGKAIDTGMTLGDLKITLTADEGYVLPTDDEVTANPTVYTVSHNKATVNFTYTRTTATEAEITFPENTTAVAGNVVIQIAATKEIEHLTVDVDFRGKVTVTGDNKRDVLTDSTTVYKYVLGTQDATSQITDWTVQTSEQKVLQLAGYTSEKSVIKTDETVNTGFTTLIEGFGEVDALYLFVYETNKANSTDPNANVVSAGCYGPINIETAWTSPTITWNDTDVTILGNTTEIQAVAFTGSAAPYSTLKDARDHISTTVIDISTEAMVVTNKGMKFVSTGAATAGVDYNVDWFFVPNYDTHNVPSEWADVRNWEINTLEGGETTEGDVWDLFNGKNGTLYLKLYEVKTGSENASYYAIKLKVNGDLTAELPVEPEADAATVVMKVGKADVEKISGVFAADDPASANAWSTKVQPIETGETEDGGKYYVFQFSGSDLGSDNKVLAKAIGVQLVEGTLDTVTDNTAILDSASAATAVESIAYYELKAATTATGTVVGFTAVIS